MASDPQNEGSMDQISVQTRIKCWWKDLPLLTRCGFVLCILLFISNQQSVACFSPRALHQYPLARIHTLIIYPYMHSGLFPIFFNLWMYLSISPTLERAFGTTPLFLLTLFFQFFAAAVFSFGVYLQIFAANEIPLLSSHACCAGLIGVLFSYLVLHLSLDDSAQRQLWCVTVPTWSYPWCLLLIIQLLFPSGTILLYIGAIVSGYIAVWYCRRSSSSSFSENWTPSFIKALESYKTSPSLTLYTHHHVAEGNNSSNTSGGGSWQSTSSGDNSAQTLIGRVTAVIPGGGQKNKEKFVGEGRKVGTASMPAPPQVGSATDDVPV